MPAQVVGVSVADQVHDTQVLGSIWSVKLMGCWEIVVVVVVVVVGGCVFC